MHYNKITIRSMAPSARHGQRRLMKKND